MTHDPDLDDLDLNALMDGQMDDAARRAALGRLARDPEAAARLMSDMAATQALRAAAADGEAPPSPILRARARRLQRALALRPYSRWAARVAAMVAIFAGGYSLGEADLAPPRNSTPAFVSEALMSHRTALIRAAMVSQPETPRYDPLEIRKATKISLPPQPAGWRITDAQVYPSDEGPSIGLSFETPSGPVSLFAFRTAAEQFIGPATIPIQGSNVAYWQEGDLAFALIGRMAHGRLQAIATSMARADLPDHLS